MCCVCSAPVAPVDEASWRRADPGCGDEGGAVPCYSCRRQVLGSWAAATTADGGQRRGEQERGGEATALRQLLEAMRPSCDACCAAQDERGGGGGGAGELPAAACAADGAM